MRWLWWRWSRLVQLLALTSLCISVTFLALSTEQVRETSGVPRVAADDVVSGNVVEDNVAGSSVVENSEPGSAVADVAIKDVIHKSMQKQSPILAPTDLAAEPVQNDWLEVSGTGRRVFVYSAFLDYRASAIRVVAIVRMGSNKLWECVLTSASSTERVRANLQIIPENWNLPYTAAYVVCKPNNVMMPMKVTLIYDGNSDESSSLAVRLIPQGLAPANLSVCVKPFHYEFNRAVWLVEFVEMYRLMGADHFFFYKHSVGPDVEHVLHYYQQLGVVTVYPWTLPVESKKEIRTEGIFAALNDCNLRSIGHYRLAAMVDVDEFLMPRQHPNLPALVSALGQHDTYIFQNVFFYLYWENDTAVQETMFGHPDGPGHDLFGHDERTPYLLTAYKTTRLRQPHRYSIRSKYIVQPDRVLKVGNHMVWEFLGKRDVMNVPANLGLSHHYRICEFGGYDCLKQPHKVDRVAHTWLLPLMRHVAKVCTAVFPTYPACPPAPPLGSPW